MASAAKARKTRSRGVRLGLAAQRGDIGAVREVLAEGGVTPLAATKAFRGVLGQGNAFLASYLCDTFPDALETMQRAKVRIGLDRWETRDHLEAAFGGAPRPQVGALVLERFRWDEPEIESARAELQRQQERRDPYRDDIVDLNENVRVKFGQADAVAAEAVALLDRWDAERLAHIRREAEAACEGADATARRFMRTFVRAFQRSEAAGWEPGAFEFVASAEQCRSEAGTVFRLVAEGVLQAQYFPAKLKEWRFKVTRLGAQAFSAAAWPIPAEWKPEDDIMAFREPNPC